MIQLTDAQGQVAFALTMYPGKSLSDISKIIGMSWWTFDTHNRQVRKKLKARSRAEVAQIVLSNGTKTVFSIESGDRMSAITDVLCRRIRRGE